MSNELEPQPETLQAALVGLLHDIGKFAQRAGAFDGAHAEIGSRLVKMWQGWLPGEIGSKLAEAIAHHSAPASQSYGRLEKVVRIADRLAAGEGQAEGVLQTDPAGTPLLPILGRVRLTTEATGEQRSYGLGPLSTSAEDLFPPINPSGVNREGYAQLWRDFTQDLVRLEKSGPVDNTLRLSTLLSLLRKYLWCVPSSTPGRDEDDPIMPDVSLYDHLKVTAAIATCLQVGLTDSDLDALYGGVEKWELPVAAMVRGDLSGIQNFIYRITRPEAEAEFEHVAKRLRGRSFYLALLTDVVTDYLVRTLGLSAANVLFSGGGRFDLLVPVGDTVTRALDEAKSKMDKWLLAEFTGDLGLQIVTVQVSPIDMADMRRAYAELDTHLGIAKQRKWERYILDDQFHISTADEYHACRVCHTTPLPNTGTCDLCQRHADIGRKLPHTTHLALAYGGDSPSTGKWLDDFRQAFGVRVALLDEEEAAKLMAELSRVPSERPATMLYRLNNADFLREDAPAGSGMGLRFLANAAPIARQTLKTGTADRIDKGEVLHFEAIAHLSTGAERLGVLKADVDHLGQIFGEGLSSETFRPTIVRYAALSGALDIFFSGWLNDLCADVSADWETAQAGLPENEQHEWMGQTDGLFYVMYSGGDDLFIIGPWDAVLTLAERLQASWADYACLNRNVTLSAGIVLAKPHYPVHRFADEVDAALEAAKDAGRDRITVFSRTVRWSDMTPGYVELMKLGRDLCDEVKAGQVPRTLVHDLGRLERQHRDTRGDGKLKPMLTPRLYYTLARRLPKEVRERLGLRLLKAMNDILIPVSYVSLATRKE